MIPFPDNVKVSVIMYFSLRLPFEAFRAKRSANTLSKWLKSEWRNELKPKDVKFLFTSDVSTSPRPARVWCVTCMCLCCEVCMLYVLEYILLPTKDSKGKADIYLSMYVFIFGCQDCEVVIDTLYGLDGWASNPGGSEISRTVRTVLRPTLPSVEWVPGLSRG